MSNELQPIEVETEEATIDVSKHHAIIKVVKDAIFPKGTDAELAIFIHRCQMLGVDPLSKAMIPIAFEDDNGNRTLSFLTTIDLARSKAEETQEYAGQDEPEFEGEIIQDCTEWVNNKQVDATMPVPEICRVKIYRRGFDRPFIGVARWKEYYPGQKKGHKWRQMPHGMLAKCAEMNGLRKAFPAKLQKLYTAEEFELTLSALSGLGNESAGGRPALNAPKAKAAAAGATESQGKPNDETRKQNHWISEGQEKRIYALCKTNQVDYRAVREYFRVMAKNPKLELYNLSWKATAKGKLSSYDHICEKIEKEPGFFVKYAPVQTTAENGPKTKASPEATSPTPTEPTPTQPQSGAAAGAESEQSGPSPREEFEMDFRATLEERFQGAALDAKAKEILDKFGILTLAQVPAAKFSDLIAAASVAVREL